MAVILAERDEFLLAMRHFPLVNANTDQGTDTDCDDGPVVSIAIGAAPSAPVVSAWHEVFTAAHGPGLALGFGPGALLMSRRVIGDVDMATAPGADGATGNAERALSMIEAAEMVHASIDAVADQAWRRLHDELFAVAVDPPDYADMSASRRADLAAEVRSLTVSEVEAATGLGVGECRHRAAFALAPRAATAAARAAMRAGSCSAYRARVVCRRDCRPSG